MHKHTHTRTHTHTHTHTHLIFVESKLLERVDGDQDVTNVSVDDIALEAILQVPCYDGLVGIAVMKHTQANHIPLITFMHIYTYVSVALLSALAMRATKRC